MSFLKSRTGYLTVFLLAFVLVASMIVSCQKDTVDSINTEIKNDTESFKAKFQKTIDVFDEERTSKISLRISSDNEELISGYDEKSFEIIPLVGYMVSIGNMPETNNRSEQKLHRTDASKIDIHFEVIDKDIKWGNNDFTLLEKEVPFKEHLKSSAITTSHETTSDGIDVWRIGGNGQVEVVFQNKKHFLSSFGPICNRILTGTEKACYAKQGNKNKIIVTRHQVNQNYNFDFNDADSEGGCYTCPGGCRVSTPTFLNLKASQNLSFFLSTNQHKNNKAIIQLYIKYKEDLDRIFISNSNVKIALSKTWGKLESLVEEGFNGNSHRVVNSEHISAAKSFLDELEKAADSAELKSSIGTIKDNLDSMKGKDIKNALRAFDRQDISI